MQLLKNVINHRCKTTPKVKNQTTQPHQKFPKAPPLINKSSFHLRQCVCKIQSIFTLCNYANASVWFAVAERTAAHIHALRVASEGSCRWPRVKVIPVRDIYSNSTTTYTPHCAILHRCSDDTGCCRSESLTCEAKTTQRVELYFYVSTPSHIPRMCERTREFAWFLWIVKLAGAYGRRSQGGFVTFSDCDRIGCGTSPNRFVQFEGITFCMDMQDLDYGRSFEVMF